MNRADTAEKIRRIWRGTLHHAEHKLPPGTRVLAGVLLMVCGVFGFLPVIGFWMFPLGVAVAALDIRPVWRKFFGPGHVGDGNFHAILLVDPAQPAESEVARKLASRMSERALRHHARQRAGARGRAGRRADHPYGHAGA